MRKLKMKIVFDNMSEVNLWVQNYDLNFEKQKFFYSKADVVYDEDLSDVSRIKINDEDIF